MKNSSSITKSIAKKFSRLLSDKMFVMLKYRIRFGKFPNLKDPKTYNEKLQWIKLYDHNPIYTTMVDKYAVKDYVSRIIGKEHIIPTIGVWKNFEDINFDKLPQQFVLKCTHDSGGLVIVRDKSTMDLSAIKEKIEMSLNTNYYLDGREWPYKNVPRRIIAEKYMEDESGTGLNDYKFFCFDGTVKALFIATDRNNKYVETKFDFYDEYFNHLPFTNGHPNSQVALKKPENFEEMIQVASKLSKGFPELRVDLYNVNGKIYFGELTLFHWGGLMPFEPKEWDYKFGSWINIPEIKK